MFFLSLVNSVITYPKYLNIAFLFHSSFHRVYVLIYIFFSLLFFHFVIIYIFVFRNDIIFFFSFSFIICWRYRWNHHKFALRRCKSKIAKMKKKKKNWKNKLIKFIFKTFVHRLNEINSYFFNWIRKEQKNNNKGICFSGLKRKTQIMNHSIDSMDGHALFLIFISFPNIYVRTHFAWAEELSHNLIASQSKL